MSHYINADGNPQPERRTNLRLRSIYDEARNRLNHFFHSSDWAGSSIDHLALRVIHEAYPDLSPEEVRTLVAAIERSLTRNNPSWGKGH
ncbi:MAG: hypothetical protein NZ524_00175 [Thiobacillaceae bacterium]|nr:hypothetical protein [Thiobacillaceae bacterium]MCX7672407.1 hypothetical protein [Thiobacillaceae bacterium]MDW8323637.1 hypothetical protein [Burkholderiales bacterium]